MDGNLNNTLSNKRNKLQEAWLDTIMATYPTDTFNYSQKMGSEFTNPVFYNFSNGAQVIIDYILGFIEKSEITKTLETLVKIRAVQNFGAAEAVKFIYLLKPVLRKEQGQNNLNQSKVSEIHEIEDKIDEVALMAFDIYMNAREKVYQIRTNELKNTAWGSVTDHESEVPVQT